MPRWQPKQLKDIDANCFLSPINRRVIKLRDDLQRRLHNLRHGLTLDGNLLPDMGWADGLDDPLVSAKGGLSRVARPYSSSRSPIPAYRFRQLLPTARSAAQQLLDFGRHYMKLMEDEFNTSLSVLLKAQEIKLCDFTFSIQQEHTLAIKVKKRTLEINKEAAIHKRDHFTGLIDEGRNALEILAATLHMSESTVTALRFALNAMKGSMAPVPDTFGFAVGGQKLWVLPDAAADSVETAATILGNTADQMLRESEYIRRAHMWEFELKQAEWEIKALDNEIQNTDLELNAATLALDQIRQDRVNLQEAYVAMTTGFTIIPVYNWLVARQEQLYGAARDAVMSLCFSVEAAWRYEIGDYKRPAFIRPSGWSEADKAGVEYCYPDPKAAKEPALPDSVKRNLRSNQQIALSSTHLEDGIGFAPGEWIYELTQNDGRYLPFEGTGAISKWHLEILDDTFAAALKGKLKDIRVTLLYTACDGGQAFRDIARAARKSWLEKVEGSDTDD